MHTKVNWFEISSADFQRAVRFYETVFDTTLKTEHVGFDDASMALFSDTGGE